ncbi:MAG: hypothetical protein WCT53_05090 [Candidatus Gracilibacteria bacterium]
MAPKGAEKPATIEQPKPVVAAAAAPSVENKTIDEIGAAQGANPAEIAKAKEEFEKRKEKLAYREITLASREDLASLMGSIKTTNPDSRHLIAAASAEGAYNQLLAMISGNSDFVGDEGKNDARDALFKLMRDNVYSKIDTKYDPQYQKEWMDACNKFMAEQVASYVGVFTTRMDEDNVKDAVRKMLDEKEGVGSFETFMSTKHQEEITRVAKSSEDQRTQVTQETEQQKALVAKKAEVTKSFEAAKEALPKEVVALPAMAQKLREIAQKITDAKDVATFTGTEAAIAKLRDIGTALTEANTSRKELERLNCPPDQLQKIDAIVQEIIDSNGSNLETKKAAIQEVVIVQKPMLEKLNVLAADADIPLEVRTTTIERVKQGKVEVEQAIKDLEGAKKLAADADKEPDADDQSLVGSVAKWAKKMPKLGWLVGALTSISVALVKIPLIGDLFRGNMISNKMLAANGDKQAQVAYKTEKEFRRFGLDASLALSLGNEPVSKALKTLAKPSDLSSDPTEQAQLAQLATQIKEKGGLLATTITLNDFIGNNPKWTEIRYDASSAAVAEYKAKEEAAKKTETDAAATNTPPAEGAAKT